ncbi:hypothetical protein [Thermoflexus sp.]|uniref:hypothetical protein n=1 Tax=Thermoflexus sp. TaxID=1969742 RepID=UPI00176388F2|nr:hypothetical protein [Thermoflexus sp.]
MKRIRMLSIMPLAIVLRVACAAPASAPQETTANEASISKIAVQGEQIPFEICGESSAWTRPTEGEQKAKWGNSGRYAGGDEKVTQYPWTHNFFVVYGNASDEYDLINLSGLWTLEGNVRSRCVDPERQDAILKLQKAEVWVLLHRVKSIKRVGADYYIIVEPVEKGVWFIQFPRPDQQVPLTLHFVTEDGREVERIVEAKSPYWPYPQLVPTRQP